MTGSRDGDQKKGAAKSRAERWSAGECPWERPKTAGELHAWCRDVMGLVFPTSALVEGHAAPFDYLAHAFFDGGVLDDSGGLPVVTPASPDSVVWANRGGGKTFLAAVATALDLIFKPTIKVRILAGSLEQAQHVYGHLRTLFEEPELESLVEGKPTEKKLRLVNRSRAQLLTQSQRSVRGTRVQKLRCDEVELFDPEVWEAAQLTTRSKMCGDVFVPGTIECLSTMHIPYGLMYRLVREAGEKGSRKLFKWGVVDVLGACGDEHDCESCALAPECGGRAKERDARGEAAGHVPIEDALTLKSRVGEQTWAAEMLGDRPRRTDCVLPEFDARVHVVEALSEGGDGRAWVCGMDFGIRAPTVVLWGAVDGDGVLRIAHERVVAGEVLAKHIEAIGSNGPASPVWVGVDPAGRQRSDQTGLSPVQVMRKAGLTVRDRKMGVNAGLDLVRARLKPASGPPRLYVHRRCAKLIESLERYRYPSDRPESLEPVKDGSDHAVDALRYLVQNLDAGYRTEKKQW
ncbi:MAG: hypothetical protein AAGI17_00280 [Planctomycetota bacterium]